MAVTLPNGAVLSVGSAYGSAITISAITNANPAVATATAHGLTDGDIIVLTSGWPRLNGKVCRIANSTVNDFELEGIDTSSTARYPAGAGAGSCKKVTTWTQITQVLEFTTQGGDQQFATYSFLEEDVEHQLPTVKSPSSFQMTVGDDASLAWYAVLEAANDDRDPRAVRIVLPAGSIIFYNGYVTLNKTPTMTKNEIMGLQSTVSLINEPVRYAS